jgi:Tol biopolymer transport system component
MAIAGVAAFPAVVAAVAMIVANLTGQPESPAQVARFLIPPPPETVMSGSFTLSPDGTTLVFVARDLGVAASRLWLRPLSAIEATPLAGTDGAALPFFSPDSRSVGFFADGNLKRVDLASGAVTVLADAPRGRGGAWSADGTIVFAPGISTALFAVRATGGEAVAVTELAGDPSHRFPHLLPDGRHFLYLVLREDRERSEVRWGELGSRRWGVVLEGASSAAYSPPGHILFVRGNTLLSQRFDADARRLSGLPVPVAAGVGRFGEAGPTGHAVFSAAGDRGLAYENLADPVARIAWVDRSGREIAAACEPAGYTEFQPSPSADRVAVVRIDAETRTSDIWIVGPPGRSQERVTFDPQPDGGPFWSPDGSRLVFTSLRGGLWRGFVADLRSGARTALEGNWTRITCWGPDGALVVEVEGDGSGADLWRWPLDGAGAPAPLVRRPRNQTQGRVSPDGGRLAYVSDETGTPEVFVQDLRSDAGRVQVSAGGGDVPAWRPDGGELFYLAGDRMMSARAAASADGALQPPVELFRTSTVTIDSMADYPRLYGVRPDGGAFLLAIPAREGAAPITVVLGWQTELGR